MSHPPQVAVFFGGLSIKKDEEVLKKNCPHIVVGTPGRILALARNKSLNLKHIKHFILDECDKMLEQLGAWGGPGGLSGVLERGRWMGGAPQDTNPALEGSCLGLGILIQRFGIPIQPPRPQFHP